VKRGSIRGIPWFEPGAWIQVSEPWSFPQSIPDVEHVPDGHEVSQADRDALIENMVQVMSVLYPPPLLGSRGLPPNAMVSAHVGRGPL
jgi:hypothetical protein